MVIIIIALFLLGFFFQPLWLILVGYLIYIYASKKSRRDEAVERRIKAMVSSGERHAIFSELYFEGAHSYAIAKGAQAPEQNAASAHILVNGEQYFATFVRTNTGGTEIFLNLSSSVRNRVTAHIAADTSQVESTSRSLRDEMDCLVEELMGIKSPEGFVDEYFCSINDLGFSNIDVRPTWFESKGELSGFIFGVAIKSFQADIADAYTVLMLKEDGFRKLLFSCVAAAESGNFDVAFQEGVAAAFIKRAWGRLDDAQRAQFRNMPDDALAFALQLND